MRNWRVLVKTRDGREISARAIGISGNSVAIRSEQVLPSGLMCELHVIVPPVHEKAAPQVADLHAEVAEIIFSEGKIRLELWIKTFSSTSREIIDSRALSR